MLGPRDRENPMRETTAYRAISISSHMVGIPGHCEKECDFKIRNDEIQHWDPTGGHGTQREATGPNAAARFFGCPPQLIHYPDRQDPYRASSVWGKTEKRWKYKNRIGRSKAHFEHIKTSLRCQKHMLEISECEI